MQNLLLPPPHCTPLDSLLPWPRGFQAGEDQKQVTVFGTLLTLVLHRCKGGQMASTVPSTLHRVAKSHQWLLLCKSRSRLILLTCLRSSQRRTTQPQLRLGGRPPAVPRLRKHQSSGKSSNPDASRYHHLTPVLGRHAHHCFQAASSMA
jgi:hypothetical protein